MAETSYGYERGDNDKIVDYSSILGKVPENLKKIEDRRAKERESIEQTIAKEKKVIQDSRVIGNTESANNVSINYADQAARGMAKMQTEMKSGIKKPSEYTQYRQNLMDGVRTMSRVFKGYNTNMDELTARAVSGEGGYWEAWNAERSQNASAFSDNAFGIDENGNGWQAPKKPDGTPDMANSNTMVNLENQSQQRYNRFDMPTTLSPIVETYGEDIRVLQEKGVLTRSDVLQESTPSGKKMLEAIKQTAASFSDDQLASVLVDFKGGYTASTKKGGGSVIKAVPMANNGNRLKPDLTDTQRDEAEEIIKNQILTMLDFKETPMAVPAAKGPTSSQVNAAAKVQASGQKAKIAASLLAKMWSGDDDDRQEVMEQLKPMIKERYGDETFRDANISGNSIVIVKKNPTAGGPDLLETIDMGDDVMSWLQSGGSALLGIDDPIAAIEAAGLPHDIDPDAAIGVGSAGVKVEEVKVPAVSFNSLELPSKDDKGKANTTSATAAMSGHNPAALATNAAKIFDQLVTSGELASTPTVTFIPEDDLEAPTGGGSKWSLTDDYDGVELFVDGVMSKPIIVPVDPDGKHYVGFLSSVVSKIYEAARNGEQLSDDDFIAMWKKGPSASVTNAWEAYNTKSSWAKKNRGPAKMSLQEIKDANPNLSVQEQMKMFKEQ